MEMSKTAILKLLSQLDKKLKLKIELIVCGGTTGIILLNIPRKTQDIDVLKSVPKISKIQNELNEIASRNGLQESWINDSAKGFMDFLPEDFKNRLELIDNDFENLTLYSISKVDFFIMKLASHRAQDLLDIRNIELSQSELKLIDNNLKRISKFDSKTALRMSLFMEEYELLKKGDKDE